MQDDADSSARLPTYLWVDAQLNILTQKAIPFYFFQKGERSSGVLMVKINGLGRGLRLLVQQRDFMTDKLEWVDALGKDCVDEREMDAFIHRSIARDPDLWVIEIEDSSMENPFEDV